MKNKKIIFVITSNAVIAALYVALSLISGSLAFAGTSFQIRLSEFLNLFVFFNPTYIIGVTIGCLITNIFSMYGFFDLLIGTFATLISGLFVILISKRIKNLFLCSIVVSFINALIIPFIYIIVDTSLFNFKYYLISFSWILLGEFISVVVIGNSLFYLIVKKNKEIGKLIGITQNQDYKW